MEIERVDLADAAAVDAWYSVYERAERWNRPFAVPWLRPEIEVEFEPSLRTAAAIYSGRVRRQVVCAGTIEMSLLDNTHSANIGVFTDPDARRLGHGSAMLAHLEALAREGGRRTAYLEVCSPMEAPVDGRGTAGADFAAARGYDLGLANIMRSLPMPVEPERLDHLIAIASTRHAGYRIETFTGPVPEEWVEGYVGLDARVATDSPGGSLELEGGPTDIASFRQLEDRIARQQRVTFSAIALHGSAVVAFSTIGISRLDPSRGYQWGTLVAADHRGHRLGLAVKAANLRQVQTEEPGLASIVTWNADANAHMIAVNDQLGYVPVERFAEYQKRW